MAKRNMTAKGFFSRILKCKTAEGFLCQYREYMLTGDIHKVTTPIVVKLDRGELQPDPALHELKYAVYAHIQAQDIAKADAVIARGNKQTSDNTTSDAKVFVGVYNCKNELMASEGFDKNQEAIRWADRRLIEAEPNSFAEIVHQYIMINGQPMKEHITREDSFYRVYRQKSGPVMKRSPQSTSRLKGTMKAVQSRAHFSYG